MQIFVFEFVTGGGWFRIDSENPPSGSLLNEGQAMLEAVATDFNAAAGIEVATLCDARLGDQLQCVGSSVAIENDAALRSRFAAAAVEADFSLVIAPEFDGHLKQLAEEVIGAGGRLLSPSPEFIALAGNKDALAERLHQQGIPVPQGVSLLPVEALPSDFGYPAVLKPVDGAGSLNVRLLRGEAEACNLGAVEERSRLERYHPGMAISIAALCGPQENHLLPPCRQRLSQDGRFAYLGGVCPLEPPLAERASRLAKQTLAALPPANGYVGIDMVLGEDASGGDDVVIEVNPRLTTSYVGLRALIRENLAEAMLHAAQGRHVELSARPGWVEFSADGGTTWLTK